MQKYYTGVGSRLTPRQILNQMFAIGSLLAEKNYILRSGGADGADTSFEKGCISKQGKKEIYVPWNNFNNRKNKNDIVLTNIKDTLQWKAADLAEAVHPRWKELAPKVKRLHTRNIFQVLGEDLNSKSDFLICWTPNGMIVGGTGTAIKVAQRFNIEIFNLAIPFQQMELRSVIKNID